MRILVVTVTAIALSTVSGHAQQSQTPWASLPKVDKSEAPNPDERPNAPKVDEKAYRSALDAIPPIKGRDPWQSVREAPKSKSPR
jgi:hypothetical protein